MRAVAKVRFLAVAGMALLASCGSSSSVTTDSANSGPSTTWPSTTSSTSPVTGSTTDNSDTKRSHKFTAEVWADNWFSLYVNGQMVAEDSIPITTERSFNAETISFDAAYPLNVAIISKDYIENETGLEYIGLPNQQMGDGGFIAQITDTTTGEVVLVTSSAWRGLVIQTAPLNTQCEKSSDPLADCQYEQLDEPTGWQFPDFDASGWMTATEYTPAEVGTKDGYDTIEWDRSAHLIWGDDLKTQNTILWRAPVVE